MPGLVFTGVFIVKPLVAKKLVFKKSVACSNDLTLALPEVFYTLALPL